MLSHLQLFIWVFFFGFFFGGEGVISQYLQFILTQIILSKWLTTLLQVLLHVLVYYLRVQY